MTAVQRRPSRERSFSLRCDSLDEAMEWIKRAPFGGGVQIELRPIFEAEDFGKELTPELRAKEDALRAKIGSQTKK